MEKVCLVLIGLLFCIAFNNDVLGKKHSRLSKSKYGGKIVGGHNVTIQEAPYQAYLLLAKGILNFQCGGSIISSKAVLSAAHCLVGVTYIRIRIGSEDSQSGGYEYTTFLYRIHPNYNPGNNDYDVGVIKTRTEMNLDGISTKAIGMPELGTEVPPGTLLFVTGWGTTSESGSTSRYLQGVKVPSISMEECRQSYGQDAITERMVCAGLREGGKDSCQGDSGGPAVNDDTGLLVGVVSFGRGCARPDYPGVYTNVSSVRAWIKKAGGV